MADKQQPQTKRVVFFTMVRHPKGLMRAGNAYPSRKAAAEWVPFVRGVWRFLRVTVSQCTLYFDANGALSERSKRLLDVKYNLDAPLEDSLALVDRQVGSGG